jgi:hypothetical protein
LFAKFRMSDSQGKYLNQHVKGKYSHTKIKWERKH